MGKAEEGNCTMGQAPRPLADSCGLSLAAGRWRWLSKCWRMQRRSRFVSIRQWDVLGPVGHILSLPVQPETLLIMYHVPCDTLSHSYN